MIWLSAIRYAPQLLLAVGVAFGLHLAFDAGKTRARASLEPKLVSLQAEVNHARARAQAEQMARERVEKTLESYHAEVLEIRTRPAPVGPVRLCRNPASRLPATPAAPGGADGAASRAGSGTEGAEGDSREGPGPDIGADLAALAASCDVVAARLRALQAWVQPPAK
jgi:hypothetical protein